MLRDSNYQFVDMVNSGPLNLYQIGSGEYDPRVGKHKRENLLRYNKDGPNYKIGDQFRKDDAYFNGAILL